ncbi:MAG TPA: M14 family zinc carboxypeptidase, partial [Ferruginibacter sp.]|nr:M14 family zinc carboxypeptidase [Ferruginibacter sp.]
EAIDWYKKLDQKSPLVRIKTMGGTDAGYPLHLVLVSSDEKFDPIKWHQQGKVVILTNNGIHPGEPDGIDASMILVRDIINKKITLPKNVAIGIIPVYNIGGCLNRNSYTRANQNGPVEYGFRGNSQNLDLNRDFTKCDSKEARAFTEIFHYLNPDILVDNHVSDGADFQHTMTLISTQYNKLGPTLGKWLRDSFEPSLYNSMSLKGWEMIPYVDFGKTDFDKGMNMFMDPPRYSSGYAALFNTLAFMPETHMLKPYKERVQSTYDLMVTFIEQSSKKANEIKSYRKIAAKEWMNEKAFPLRWAPDSSQHSEILFKGYEKNYAISDATGLQKMYYDHSKAFAKQIKFYHGFLPAEIVSKPKAYIIPQGWNAVLDLLKLNKVKLSQLKTDTIISITAYHMQDYKSFPRAYEKHHKNYGMKVSISQKQLKFLKGDFIVYLDQPANRYIIEMLEPTADDSFFAWNFFDAILQQKEGYSDYRWEDIAAEVLKSNTDLKEKLKTKMASDSKFASDSGAILDYIYKNSVYYEKAHLQYPVYRIEN